jgi:hypothetical protein
METTARLPTQRRDKAEVLGLRLSRTERAPQTEMRQNKHQRALFSSHQGILYYQEMKFRNYLPDLTAQRHKMFENHHRSRPVPELYRQ